MFVAVPEASLIFVVYDKLYFLCAVTRDVNLSHSDQLVLPLILLWHQKVLSLGTIVFIEFDTHILGEVLADAVYNWVNLCFKITSIDLYVVIIFNIEAHTHIHCYVLIVAVSTVYWTLSIKQGFKFVLLELLAMLINNLVVIVYFVLLVNILASCIKRFHVHILSLWISILVLSLILFLMILVLWRGHLLRRLFLFFFLSFKT